MTVKDAQMTSLFRRFSKRTQKRSATGQEQTADKHGSLKVKRCIIIIVTAVTIGISWSLVPNSATNVPRKRLQSYQLGAPVRASMACPEI